ncbi:hypothetical protein G9F71_011835 [Clostridium sp. FP2]|nr:hypothetical protein [Clostridium tagluense]MBZ9623542.1 hypothetical protein [Clostridium sp. FP2]WLC67929.1 hypothetical protein KTC93_11240 [Clostridium tagluense]
MSWATVTFKAYLKAIENALNKLTLFMQLVNTF